LEFFCKITSQFVDPFRSEELGNLANPEEFFRRLIQMRPSVWRLLSKTNEDWEGVHWLECHDCIRMPP